MNPTAFVRKVDELGRVVIPIDLRRALGISIRDALDIYVDGSRIILKKNAPSCVFCEGTADLDAFKDRLICSKCRSELSSKD